MQPRIALVLCLLLIGFLFIRDHKNNPQLSLALWLPALWFFLLGTRSIYGWLHLGAADTGSLEAYWQSNMEGNAVDRYGLLLLMLVAMVIVARRKPSWDQVLRRNLPLLGFLVFSLMSVVWSDFPLTSLKRWIRFFGIVPMILIVLSERSPTEAAVSVIRRCSYVLVIISVLFVKYYPNFGRYYDPWTFEVGYCGICDTKNELGLLCIIAAVVFLWDLKRAWGRPGRSFLSVDTLLTMLLMLITLYLTYLAHSSTSTLCIIVGFLVLMITSLPAMRRNPRAVPYRVAGIMLLFVVLQLVLNVKDALLAGLGRDSTLTGRTDIWRAVLSLGSNPIFGTGWESFWTTNRVTELWSTFGIRVNQSHNGYIDTFLNLGIIGVAFLVALLARCFMKATREMEHDFAHNQLRLAFLVIYALYNISEAAFPRPGLLLAIFLLFTIDLPVSALAGARLRPAKRQVSADVHR